MDGENAGSPDMLPKFMQADIMFRQCTYIAYYINEFE